MNTIDNIINICTEEIPQKYYGRTYVYFSFEIFDDEPMHLYLEPVMDDGRREKIVITGLNETAVPIKDFVDFLKSIKFDNSNPFYPVSFDLKIAREKYNIHVEVNGEKKGD